MGERDLAAALGGALTAEGLVEVEHRLPLPARHGRWTLEPGVAGHLAPLGFEAGEALFLDTETTGLAGGTGTTAFLVGAARVAGEALLVRHYLLTRFAGEPAMLAALAAFAAGARTLVTFNGRSFDLPLLAARYRLAGLPDPFAGRPHADLLHPVRRAFARRWADCRLATAERELLGFLREGDLPGAEVPAVWLHWLRVGDAGRLPAVLAHNRWDLVSLAALLPALDAAFAAPHAHGADILAIARGRRTREGPEAAHRLLAASRAGLDTSGLLELARLARGQGDPDTALAIWRELAAGDHPRALEALARHAEHRDRDLEMAARLVERLLALEPWSAAHRARAARIAEKRRRAPGSPGLA
jgi:hypothetical protein